MLTTPDPRGSRRDPLTNAPGAGRLQAKAAALLRGSPAWRQSTGHPDAGASEVSCDGPPAGAAAVRACDGTGPGRGKRGNAATRDMDGPRNHHTTRREPDRNKRKPQDITNMGDRNPKATHEQDRQRLAVTDHGPKGRGRGRKEAVG